MFNPRLGGLAAGLAFIVSLFIGMVTRSSFPALILRPLILGAFAFGLSVIITLLINHFLPELLEHREPEVDFILPGSRIDIKEDAPVISGDFYARPDDSDESLGNISDLSSSGPVVSGSNSGGIDQNGLNGYTDDVRESVPETGDGFDVLPDLESLAGAFLPSSGSKTEEVQEYQSSDAPRKPGVGNRPHKMDGDFNPKDLAAGIRTILKRQEG